MPNSPHLSKAMFSKAIFFQGHAPEIVDIDPLAPVSVALGPSQPRCRAVVRHRLCSCCEQEFKAAADCLVRR